MKQSVADILVTLCLFYVLGMIALTCFTGYWALRLSPLACKGIHFEEGH